METAGAGLLCYGFLLAILPNSCSFLTADDWRVEAGALTLRRSRRAAGRCSRDCSASMSKVSALVLLLPIVSGYLIPTRLPLLARSQYCLSARDERRGISHGNTHRKALTLLCRFGRRCSAAATYSRIIFWDS